jgi:hypothetical protein
MFLSLAGSALTYLWMVSWIVIVILRLLLHVSLLHPIYGIMYTACFSFAGLLMYTCIGVGSYCLALSTRADR